MDGILGSTRFSHRRARVPLDFQCPARHIVGTSGACRIGLRKYGVMSSVVLHDSPSSATRERTSGTLRLRRWGRRAIAIGAGAALAVAMCGLAVAVRLTYAAGRWPALHDALHRVAPAIF